MADLLGASSNQNQLIEVLKKWNEVLQHSSLGCGKLSDTEEGKDGSAPRDSHRAVVRRRKTG
jgi:hypothetical protein